MEFDPMEPPRLFTVGAGKEIEIRDCGRVRLEPDEQITFVTQSGTEFDLARKDWGYYATPSLNGRLTSFGLRGVLIKNRDTLRYFVLLVENGKEELFENYCQIENLAVISWLDSDEALQQLEAKHN